jgi:hypothetical protein
MKKRSLPFQWITVDSFVDFMQNLQYISGSVLNLRRHKPSKHLNRTDVPAVVNTIACRGISKLIHGLHSFCLLLFPDISSPSFSLLPLMHTSSIVLLKKQNYQCYIFSTYNAFLPYASSSQSLASKS